MADYLLSYLGTPGATVTYSIDAADKSEDTAETGTGVTEMHAGTVTSLYGVVVTDPPMGGVVNWYESGVFQTSEAITQDDAAVAGDAMTLTEAYDAAKTAASQTSVDATAVALAAAKAVVDAILAENVGADLGTDVCTITLRDASGSEVADARVYVSSDAAGLVRSDIRVTNALGQVAFDLTAGNTYYLWAFSTLVDFTAVNPISFVAVAD